MTCYCAIIMVLSGLQQLQEIQSGQTTAPTGFSHFPTQIESLERGAVTLLAPPPLNFTNPKGDVHGGFVSVILLNSLACTVQSTMLPGQGFVTLEMKVNFGKAVRPDDVAIRAKGKIIHIGKRTAIAEARMMTHDQQLIGTAQATFLVIGDPHETAL